MTVLFAHRFHWTPEQVRGMTPREIRLLVESMKPAN